MKATKKVIIISISVSLCVSLLILILNLKRFLQFLKGDIMQKSYFTIDELCASDTAAKFGILNSPSAEIKANLQALIDKVLDPARREYGSYIIVNSGYRSPELNKKVGGAATSQHLTGEAADLTTGNLTNNKKLFDIIKKQSNFDQLIWENGGAWVHVSYSQKKAIAGVLRKQVLNIG